MLRHLLTACSVLFSASLALAQAPPRATSADVRITLTAVKSPILVGEFTKVKADWQFLRQVGVLWESERLLIDDGTGYRRHVEGSVDNNASVARAVEVMAPGDRRISERVVGVAVKEPVGDFTVEKFNAAFGFAFPQPGTYAVKMRYEDAESNPVTIQVVAPTGADADVLAGIRTNMAVFTPFASNPSVVQQWETLISTYAGHKYLAPLVREFNGGDDYLRIDHVALDRRSAFDFSETAFAADEALLQARVGRELFGEAFARPAFQRVAQLYPDREAGMLAAVELRRLDETPR